MTPSDLVQALRFNGGVSNSIAEIIGINRTKLQEFVTENDEIIKDLKVENNAEIQFNHSTKTARVFEYSSVGDGKCFKLTLDMEAIAEESKYKPRDGDPDSDEGDELDDYNPTIIEDAESSAEVDQNDLLITERGTITGCIIYGGLSPAHRLSFLDPQNAEASDVEVDEDPLQCRMCKRRFSHDTNLQRHVCEGVSGKMMLLYHSMVYTM